MAAGDTRAVGCLAMAFILVIAAGIGGFIWLRQRGATEPVLAEQRCVATAGKASVTLDLDQAHLASIIVGLSVRRGLPARAASIALATAYQETGIRNLDYGDRDSVGVFQQRPSQGWGTVKQLMDPYYSTNKFYDALVRVENWRTDDINDVAQKVQRSGYPEAYRDHESDARVLASVLTGHSPAGLSCLERQAPTGRAKALVTSMQKTYGKVSATSQGKTITVKASTATSAWTFAHYAIANTVAYGVTDVQVGTHHWHTQAINLPGWSATSPALGESTVSITVR